MTLELPKQIGFSEPGRQYLEGFYLGHGANTVQKKIEAIRTFILKEDVLVTSVTGADNDAAELLALEYYVLLEAGFDE